MSNENQGKKNITVLFVGDRFIAEYENISAEISNVASDTVEAHFCPDHQFALSRIPIYCEYQIVVVNWSKYALLLALFISKHMDYRPKIVLLSGIIDSPKNPSIKDIMAYGLFDYFISTCHRSWSPHSWREVVNELSSVPPKSKTIEFETTVGFYAYMWRNHVFKSNVRDHFYILLHNSGEETDWTKLPITKEWAFEAFPNEFRREVIEMSHEMDVKPVWGLPLLSPGARAKCFVLMPFKSPFNEIYEDFIKPGVNDEGLKSVRSDDFYTTNTVMTDIWNGLNNCLFVIAELTGRNANVMYELGIAHTLGKEVILICQDTEDVPFDFQHMRYYRYDYTPRGCELLKASLKKAISEILAK